MRDTDQQNGVFKAPQYGFRHRDSSGQPVRCIKIPYSTADDAQKAMVAARKRRKRGKKETGYYKCRFCDSFHLTSQL